MELTPTAFKRIVKDVKSIMKEPLHDSGIYYVHDEENVTKGYALIIGPSETPYAYGNYFFEIDYPYDYPYSPPKFTFLTNADNIRMNPNLYRNGKVCISILNTWKGEPWSSCQTIQTVLLTLLTIFNDKPLLNEPGYDETSSDFVPYNEIIRFKNIEIAIIKVLKGELIPHIVKKFNEEVWDKFLENYDIIANTIKKKNTSQRISTRLYNMNVKTNYKEVKKQLLELFKSREKNK